MITIEDRYKFKASNHSAFLAVIDDEKVSQVWGYCYSAITYGKKRVTELYLFFDDREIAYKNYKYLKWLVKDSMFKDVFVTKDVFEGMSTGFEVNTKQDRVLVNAGMMMLRRPFEDMNFSFHMFNKLGLSVLDSVILSNSLKLRNKIIYDNGYNTNHRVFNNESPKGFYEGTKYKPSNTNYFEGVEDYSIMTQTAICGSAVFSPYHLHDNLKQHLDCGKIKFNKTNCKKILEYIG